MYRKITTFVYDKYGNTFECPQKLCYTGFIHKEKEVR